MVEISNPSKPSKSSDELLAFVEELRRQDVARKTLFNYRSDVGLFARWFEGSRGEPFSAAAVTPTDIRDYRSYLMTSAGVKRPPPTAGWRRSESSSAGPRAWGWLV